MDAVSVENCDIETILDNNIGSVEDASEDNCNVEATIDVRPIVVTSGVD